MLKKNKMSRGLTHLNRAGEAQMVDVSHKPKTNRAAVASAEIRLLPATIDLIEHDRIAKGNVYATARIAGIQAAKRTSELIPLCHPLAFSHCEVQFEVAPLRDRVRIRASVKIAAQTGVEMEALTAVTVAALTIYDMCKGVDSTLRITDVRLVSKTKSPIGPDAN